MDGLAGKRVFITGAASGIGREVAGLCAREGALILAADLDHAGLKTLREELERGGARCHLFQLDVSDRAAVEETARAVEEEFGTPDVLINVAGVFSWSFLADTPYEDWEWIMGVNLWGPIHTIYAFLPGMIARHGGHIVNVASLGGLVTIPGVGAYSVSKFGLVGLTETLQLEMGEHGIAVTLVCPGSIKTPIIDHVRVHGFDYEKLQRKMYPISNRYPVEKAARAIVKGIVRGKPFVIITPAARIAYWTKRLSPTLYRAGVRPMVRVMKLMR